MPMWHGGLSCHHPWGQGATMAQGVAVPGWHTARRLQGAKGAREQLLGWGPPEARGVGGGGPYRLYGHAHLTASESWGATPASHRWNGSHHVPPDYPGGGLKSKPPAGWGSLVTYQPCQPFYGETCGHPPTPRWLAVSVLESTHARGLHRGHGSRKFQEQDQSGHPLCARPHSRASLAQYGAAELCPVGTLWGG